MNTVFIVGNEKGGVGKSTTATNLGTCLFYRGRNFRIVELDDHNNSMMFANSQILGGDKTISLKLDQKVKAIGSMIFNLAKNQEMDFILDIGGGSDFHAVIENLKELKINKKWLIPTTSDKKYLANAARAFELIDDPQNTYFVLNKVYSMDNLENEFMYFFGNKKYGVKAVSECFSKTPFLAIPHSQFFQIAEDDEMTLLDLGLISMEKDEEQIQKEFLEIVGDDENKFITLWENYERSKEAAKIFMKIEKSFKKLLN